MISSTKASVSTLSNVSLLLLVIILIAFFATVFAFCAGAVVKKFTVETSAEAHIIKLFEIKERLWQIRIP